LQQGVLQAEQRREIKRRRPMVRRRGAVV
jgi:hypothetical protein